MAGVGDEHYTFLAVRECNKTIDSISDDVIFEPPINVNTSVPSQSKRK